MEKHLLCCDTSDELLKLKSICKADYIIATGKYEFYKQISVCEEETIFLESDEIIQYETTWNLLDQIHSIIDSVSALQYSRLFHFSYNIEGGFPTKIAQMIINLNLIHKIVQEYEIKEIYLFDNKDNWDINESIWLYAQSRQLLCYIFDGESGNAKSRLKTLEKMDAVNENVVSDVLLLEEQKRIEYIIKKASKILQNGKTQQEIGALYCCKNSYDKHVKWMIQKINNIGNETKVICYYDTDDVKKFKDKGLKTECLENYFILEDFLTEYHKLKGERSRILQIIGTKLHASYLDVDLSKFLVIKIRNYYYREVIDHLYMSVCAQSYFKFNKFDFILMWGDTNFWETWICYDNTRENNTKLFLMDWNGFNYSRRKQPYPNMISMVFAPKGLYNEYIKECQGRVSLINDPLWDEKLKKAIPIEKHEKKKRIAVLPSGIIGGLTTYYFYYNTLIAVVEILLKKGFEVILKNHPGRNNDCWEQDVRQRFDYNENFKFMDPYEPVETVLEQCYVVITDISSVAFDAAVVHKAVFCIVDKQGYNLISQHEKGFYIYQNLESMYKKIELIVEDDREYKRIIEKQKSYMIELACNKDIDMNGRIQKVLHDMKK